MTASKEYKYDDLYNALIDAISSGRNKYLSLKSDRKILALTVPFQTERSEAFRVIDRRLQALRKRRMISFQYELRHIG